MTIGHPSRTSCRVRSSADSHAGRRRTCHCVVSAQARSARRNAQAAERRDPLARTAAATRAQNTTSRTTVAMATGCGRPIARRSQSARSENTNAAMARGATNPGSQWKIHVAAAVVSAPTSASLRRSDRTLRLTEGHCSGWVETSRIPIESVPQLVATSTKPRSVTAEAKKPSPEGPRDRARSAAEARATSFPATWPDPSTKKVLRTSQTLTAPPVLERAAGRRCRCRSRPRTTWATRWTEDRAAFPRVRRGRPRSGRGTRPCPRSDRWS